MTQSLQPLLEQLYQDFRHGKDGQVASYIPELAKANPDWFGICIVTIEGDVYCVGDVDQRFTIQSISKVFTYGIALEDQGRSVLLSKVGVEPTGDPFNSIIRLDENSHRPHLHPRHFECDEYLRHVQLRRRMGLPRRDSGQERRLGRDYGRRPRQDGDCGVLAAPRCPWQ
jgi:hypothetical protein